MASVESFLRFGAPPDPNDFQSSPSDKMDVVGFVKALHEYLGEIVSQLEEHSDQTDSQAGGPYTPTNVTTTRTFDADATTVAELADVLGTLIEDFQERGDLS